MHNFPGAERGVNPCYPPPPAHTHTPLGVAVSTADGVAFAKFMMCARKCGSYEPPDHGYMYMILGAKCSARYVICT
jgi:hypothetical protein